MSWIIEIAKLLPLCAGTALVLAVATMLTPLGERESSRHQFDFRNHRLTACLGRFLNVVIGLVLSRLTVVGDAAGRMHFSLR